MNQRVSSLGMRLPDFYHVLQVQHKNRGKIIRKPFENSCHSGEQASHEDWLRRFEIEASEQATRLDYEGQQIDYQEDALNREFDAIELRPGLVQRANLIRGLFLAFLGSLILGVHFVLGLWALSWLQMEWMTYAIAFGISTSGAAGTSFVLQGILKIFKKHKHDAYTICITFSATFILLVSMVCSAGLGRFRSELVAMRLHETTSPVILQGEKVELGEQLDAVAVFYEKNLPLLGLVFPIMSILFDFASGLLLHVGLDKVITSTASIRMIRKRDRLNRLKVKNATLRDTIHLMPEKRLFEMKDRQRLERKTAREKEEKMAYRTTSEFRNKKIAFGLASFVVATIILLLLAARGWSDTVVGIDLSLSEKTASVNGQHSLEVNKRLVGDISQTLGPGESFHVVGITTSSRSDPWIILSAKMSETPGFFSERLHRGRAVILASWKRSAKRLKLFAKKTDLLGFLEIGSDLLSESKTKKLYVLSDGKNCTDALNLEKAPRKAISFAEKLSQINDFPNLEGVDVYWLGAGGPGTSNVHLNSLEVFWNDFIERSGGTLKQFSSLREVRP